MRLLFFLLLLSITAGAQNPTYYVSTSGSAAGLGTEASPWDLATLQSKWPSIANSATVRFKRGDVFYGLVSPSGSKTGLVLSDYGTGALPVLSGFKTVTNWTSLGGNRYEATVLEGLSSLHMLTIDGKQYGQGRYPNENAANRGWLKNSTVSGTNTLTATALPASPSWTGARINNRTARWAMDTATVTSHTYAGGASTLVTNGTKTLKTGYGFFFTNHPQTLDQHGEWYYNPTTQKLQIYLSAAPAGYVIKVATLESLLDLNADQDCIIENLRLEGANGRALLRSGPTSSGHIIRGCEFQFIGDDAIYGGEASSSVNWTIHNCSFQDIGDFAIDARTVSAGWYIHHNTFKRIGIVYANGGEESQHRTAIIFSTGDGHRVEYNRIDSVGYVGVRWNGTNARIRYNEISYFNLNFDDGGGIYTGNRNSKAGGLVEYNIVRNGRGAPEGTTATNYYAVGIYSDDGSNGGTGSATLTYRHNTAYQNGDAGLYLHNNWNVVVEDNTLYDNGNTQMQFVHDNAAEDSMSLIVAKRNICVARTDAQWTNKFWNKQDSAGLIRIDEPKGMNGTGAQNTRNGIDSNYYMRPTNDQVDKIYVIWQLYNGAGVEQRRYYTIAEWSARFGHDKATRESPVKYPSTTQPADVIEFLVNPGETPLELPVTRTAKSPDGTIYPAGSTTLQPFTSLVLVKYDGPVGQDPPAPPRRHGRILTRPGGPPYRTGARWLTERAQ